VAPTTRLARYSIVIHTTRATPIRRRIRSHNNNKNIVMLLKSFLFMYCIIGVQFLLGYQNMLIAYIIIIIALLICMSRVRDCVS